MAKRLYNLFTILSAFALWLIVVAWVLASSFDPRKQFVTLFSDCHVSIDARGADARLEVFNDLSYGPYAGSIIGISGDPNGPKASGIGDIAGIYYRVICWPNGTLLWTLSVSLFYPAVAAAVLPLLWFVRHSRRRRRGFPVEAKSAAA